MDRSRAHSLVQAWIDQAYDEDGYTTDSLPRDWPLLVWQVLIEDFPDLRYWAARQLHCPEPIVRRLAAEKDWRARSRVAEKRNLPADLFPVLARDPDEVIRRQISCNQKTPLALVEELTRDREESVARVASYNLAARRAKLAMRRQREADPKAPPPPRRMPPRLSVLLARAAPVAVILRRGPSKQTLMVRWDVEHDTFDAGQWFKGRVYEHRCNLSPHGDWLVCFVADHRSEHSTWTVICRPPYFTALALWPKGDTWSGGGLFETDHRLLLSHPADHAALAEGFELPSKLAVDVWPWERQQGSAFGRVYAGTMSLGGWVNLQVGAARRGRLDPAEVWTKRSPRVPSVRLRLSICGHDDQSEQRGCLIEADSGASVDLGNVDWADWCPSGDLLLARDAQIFRISVGLAESTPRAVSLVDLRDQVFEARAAPPRALQWSGPTPGGVRLPSARRPADAELPVASLRELLMPSAGDDAESPAEARPG